MTDQNVLNVKSMFSSTIGILDFDANILSARIVHRYAPNDALCVRTGPCGTVCCLHAVEFCKRTWRAL